MAIKDMLSKFSQFSLKSKVGLGVMAVLCGVLSWSVASNYFSGEESGNRRRVPTGNGAVASKSGDDDDADDEDDSVMDSQEGSELFDRFNASGQDESRQQPPEPGYYGSVAPGGGDEDRYAGYSFGDETGGGGGSAAAIQQPENAQNSYPEQYQDYRNQDSGSVQNIDAEHDPFANSGSFGSSTGTPSGTDPATSLANNTTLDGSTDRYANTTPGYSTPGYNTPAHSAGNTLPRLDRSTPALDQSSPPSSGGAVPQTGSTFRSPGDQSWGNSAGSQPTNIGTGTSGSGRTATPNSQVIYPSGADSGAKTVRAGGNRRMQTINSTPTETSNAVVPNQLGANVGEFAAASRNAPSSLNAIGQDTAVEDQTVKEFIAGAEDSFWTIAKSAYGEGGYFAALHAYNSASIAKVEDLRVGDIVRAPSTALLRRQFPTLCPKAQSPETPTSPAGSPANNLRSNHRADVQNDEHVNLAVANGNDTNSQVQQADGFSSPTTVHNGTEHNGKVYTTKNGDDLFSIAREELGSAVRWAELYELNKDLLGENVDKLAAGLELRLPATTNSSRENHE